MTTTRLFPPARPAGAAAQRVSQARVVGSEWTKLRSLPSTVWSLLAAVVLIVGFGALYCLLRVTRPPSNPAALAALLRSREVAVSEATDGALAVSGLSTDQVGRLAGGAGITLLELTAQQASLEEAFIDLTRDAVEFRAPTTGGAQP